MITPLAVLWLYVACCAVVAVFYTSVIKKMTPEKQAAVDWLSYSVIVLFGPVTLLRLIGRWYWLKYQAWSYRRRLMKYIMTELKKEIARQGIEIVD